MYQSVRALPFINIGLELFFLAKHYENEGSLKNAISEGITVIIIIMRCKVTDKIVNKILIVKPISAVGPSSVSYNFCEGGEVLYHPGL